MMYREPDFYERISALNKVKLQRLISWLSEKELVALMNSADLELEDAVLDNTSHAGRIVVLENLGFSEEDFLKRASVRKKISDLYAEQILNMETPPDKSQRAAIVDGIVANLNEEERAAYNNRFKEKVVEIGEALRHKLSGYLDLLEKGASYKHM
ncbi:MAG TPA: hypothetical protein PKE49_16045 [Leptospiraceae bacterium]|nr:hypothetical protein [Leptospirales bacterium]HMU83134.1 hypothetical protein [Leptospiraceae bacterium]HMW61686.1 hypothetical protein [Leptospiraceae bacterium]HMX58035.1 hypothetical protein [Leptospiraceae bacterium]HMY45194.1 hypothetical protein [Leptospiraceae bacterium]